jgi:hypothetical protein
MLPRSRPESRIHPDCPPGVSDRVRQLLAVAVARKPIYAGDRLSDLVVRHCPAIFAVVEEHGFELRFDLPENSHKALCRGRLFYQIRRKTQVRVLGAKQKSSARSEHYRF